MPCAAVETCDRPDDKRNYVILVRELRIALDKAGAADRKRYLVTIAAGADRSFLYDGTSAAWMVELAGILDWVNLMTYDYHGSWEKRAGLVAPLHRDPADAEPEKNVDTTVSLYLAAGVPALKLTLGIPFYGKGWSGCDPGPQGDGLHQPCAGAVPEPAEATFEFWRLRRDGYLQGKQGFTRHRHATVRTPYLYSAQTKTFVSYEDAESVREKVRYLKSRGLRGAMYWELALDHELELGRAIASELGPGSLPR